MKVTLAESIRGRGALSFFVLKLLFFGVLSADAWSAQEKRPNIILIVGDDMGYADIGVHGCRDIPTPHIDALAAAGVRCTSGYVSGPYCSPTRAGLLTGRYQTRFGHEFNPGGGQRRPRRRQAQAGQGAQQQAQGQGAARRRRMGLPLSEITIADRLKAAGYTTGLVGKWHLGGGERFHPQRRGFDEFFGFLGGAHPYFPAEEGRILRGKERVDEQEYLTDALGREAVAFIDRHREQPFFLYLAFNAVHTPMHANEARLEKFKDISDERRRTYAAMMSAMDDAIGAVADKLRETQLEENTLVFFISDNGGPTMPGTSGNASNNAPLRGSKRTTLEGGIRVPYFVKWPAQLPAGKVYKQPAIQIDLLPTALAAAGVEIGDDKIVEGVNLLPHLRGEGDGAPHEALYWRFGRQMAIRQGDWKLVRYDATVDGLRGQFTEPKLYNLAADIGENNDLMEKEPEIAAGLQAKWDEWNKSNVPALWGDGRGRGRRSAGRQPAEASTP
ncbi:MAG TPA: sulfatase [Lacipirellulaceae bacterium]|nr:sulfatase [Lacipirellulaceae bacterium]